MIWSQEILDRNFSDALGNYYKLVRYLIIYPVLGVAIKFLYICVLGVSHVLKVIGSMIGYFSQVSWQSLADLVSSSYFSTGLSPPGRM